MGCSDCRRTPAGARRGATSLVEIEVQVAVERDGLIGYLFRCAVCAGEPYDGSAVTSGFSVWQNAITPATSSAPDPVAIMTLFGLAPHMLAMASWKSATWTGG
jgi:hypothetical protein